VLAWGADVGAIGHAKSSNNFGALRLFFAVLVILSHSFDLVDGDRSREILTRIFGTLSFGELGVDGFFLISGYLVTKSFQESQSTREYFLKRVLRIYPGYVVAYLLCVLAIGPFVGGQIASLPVIKTFTYIVSLQTPEMDGVFAGTPYPHLNGSMWTIAYEFRCYLLVLAVGLAGLLSKRSILVILTVASLALSAKHPVVWNCFPYRLVPYLGDPNFSLRFTGVFGCGALFYLYRDRIRYDWRPATLAVFGLIALMFSRHLAEAALAILGGYLLFWFAFKVRSTALAAVGYKADISYGVYLYAWPVQKLLIWLYPGISPWLVFIETTAIASILALGSWWLVEKPFLSLKAAIVVESGPKLTVSSVPSR
jgi:peptidoglycan/LPS O-acetylase OafA/YrhL